jgi:membrane-associated phospholipid phosphatase
VTLFSLLAIVTHAEASGFESPFPMPYFDFEDPSNASDRDADSNPATVLLVPVLSAQDEKPPTPARTGFRAILSDIGGDFTSFPRRRSTWVFLAAGAGGALLAHPIDDTANAHLAGSTAAGRFFAPGKWIGSGYVQAGTAVGVYLIGRYVVPKATGGPKTNKVSHLGLDLIRGIVLSQALTHGIKIIARRDRPTGECCAFPSGHAATAFATASVLERHLGYRAAWPTLLLAAYVGTSRLHDNRHYVSDVVFGSALGLASGWTVVGDHGRSNYTVVPSATPGGVMITFVRTPEGEDR